MVVIVTSTEALRARIGDRGAQDVSEAARRRFPLAQILDVGPGSGPDSVKEALWENFPGASGVQILGGPDVIPFHRKYNPAHGVSDRDEFIPTDNPYVDREDDDTVDVPIARLPDGKSADLMLCQLGFHEAPAPGSFALGNWKRKYVERVARRMPEPPDEVLWSMPTQIQDLAQDAANRSYCYVLLHGDDDDTTHWWGEGKEPGDPAYPVAFAQTHARCHGICFAGCCYGAHIDSESTAGDSIALALLASGARCFVGSTVIHYSTAGYSTSYNGPLFHKLFWNEVSDGFGPAIAYFRAKRAYAERVHAMPPSRRPLGKKMLYAFVYYGCL